MPTKMRMEPRSIWKDEALVSVSATYMMEVAMTSHNAGGSKMSGEYDPTGSSSSSDFLIAS